MKKTTVKSLQNGIGSILDVQMTDQAKKQTWEKGKQNTRSDPYTETQISKKNANACEENCF